MPSPGPLGWTRLDLADWERTSVVISVGGGLLAVLWLHAVRLLKREEAQQVDGVGGQEAATTRQELAAERDRLVDQLGERLEREGADLAQLEALRAYAQSVAEARGVAGLDPAPGPVGATIIADLLAFDTMRFSDH
jgi:hypothetical protein